MNYVPVVPVECGSSFKYSSHRLFITVSFDNSLPFLSFITNGRWIDYVVFQLHCFNTLIKFPLWYFTKLSGVFLPWQRFGFIHKLFGIFSFHSVSYTVCFSFYPNLDYFFFTKKKVFSSIARCCYYSVYCVKTWYIHFPIANKMPSARHTLYTEVIFSSLTCRRE